ncbi:MAG: DUF924 family protein [Pseudomonadota bacterium]
MQPATPARILEFWFDEVGPKGWYGGGEALDETVRARFGPAWDAARIGAYDGWQTDPAGSLALILLLDQFPRNIHRGSWRAFSTDARGRRVARRAIARGDDRRVDEFGREFFYMPFMHSERPPDQDLCVRLVKARLPRRRANTLPHAKAHRAIIETFGRFPYRNDALGRETTPEEARWLREEGYAAELARAKGEAG